MTRTLAVLSADAAGRAEPGRGLPINAERRSMLRERSSTGRAPARLDELAVLRPTSGSGSPASSTPPGVRTTWRRPGCDRAVLGVGFTARRRSRPTSGTRRCCARACCAAWWSRGAPGAGSTATCRAFGSTGWTSARRRRRACWAGSSCRCSPGACARRRTRHAPPAPTCSCRSPGSAWRAVTSSASATSNGTGCTRPERWPTGSPSWRRFAKSWRAAAARRSATRRR